MFKQTALTSIGLLALVTKNCDNCCSSFLFWLIHMMRVIEIYHEYDIVREVKKEPIVLPQAPKPVIIEEANFSLSNDINIY